MIDKPIQVFARVSKSLSSAAVSRRASSTTTHGWNRAGSIAGLCLSLSLGLVTASGSAIDIPPARVKEISAWLPAKPTGVGRSITARAAWEELRKKPEFARIISEAAALAKETVPELPDDLYLDYSRTGNRTRCQAVIASRDKRIVTFTLAECLENQGRFIGPLAEAVEAICAEKSWLLPAHDSKLDNFYGRVREMDLRATTLAWELAAADFVLGEKLPSETRRLLRDNVQQRVLRPFREMIEGKRKPNLWIRATHNWNAVCLAGVMGAALAIEESREDRAWFAAVAEQSIRNFLSGFTPDGYCSEGMGYWNYGFGRFLMLNETLRQGTNGRLDLLANPAAMQPALYALRSEVINGVYPTVSDCHPGSKPEPVFVRYIAERFALNRPECKEADFRKPYGGLAPTLLFCFMQTPLPPVPHPAIPADSPARTWFTNGGILICRASAARPDRGFAAVLKGGHNAEHHNHNDVGSFSVIAGKSMLICDPGSEVYTARTFSAKRYESKVLSSYGHAVPVVAGKLQRTGADAKAGVLRTDFADETDTLSLDLTSAYSVPELKQLERTFTFSRKSPTLIVRDLVAFTTPQSFATTLITWGEWTKTSERELLITEGSEAVRVAIETDNIPFKIASETLDEDVTTPKKPVRIALTLAVPVQKTTVTLTISATNP